MTRYGITQPEHNYRGHDHNSPNAFSKWAMYEKPQRRAGRPVLNAKAFRVDKSLPRRVWRTGFGVDYLRYFAPDHMATHLGEEQGLEAREANVQDFKLLELNRWVDAEGNNSYPAHGFDVYVQRLSVYVQRSMDHAGLINEDWKYRTGSEYAPRDSEEIERAESVQRREEEDEKHAEDETKEQKDGVWRPSSQAYENGTTLIVFESSHSGLVRDTLVEARADIERKWVSSRLAC